MRASPSSKKFIGINPQLSSVVSALSNIVKAIESAEPNWWKSSESSFSSPNAIVFRSEDDDADGISANAQDGNGEEELIEVVDLQPTIEAVEIRSEEENEAEGKEDEELDEKTVDNTKRRKINNIKENRKGNIATANELRKDNQPKTSNAAYQYENCNHVDTADTAEDEVVQNTVQFESVQVWSEELEHTTTNPHENDGIDIDATHNHSCEIPSSCPDLSPIAKEGSQQMFQSQQAAFALTNMIFAAASPLGEHSKANTRKTSCTNPLKKRITREKEDVEVSPDSDGGQKQAESSKTNNMKRIEQLKGKEVTATNRKTLLQSSAPRKPLLPKVFLLSSSSTLTTSQQRCIRKCQKDGMFELLQPFSDDTPGNSADVHFDFERSEEGDHFRNILFSKDDEEDKLCIHAQYAYALSFNAEFKACDGYIVPRSFRYLLAIACGMPIVDISYITAHSSRKRHLHAPGAAEEGLLGLEAGVISARPAQRKKRSRSGLKNTEDDEVYFVVGDVGSESWTGPCCSRREMLKRISIIPNLQPCVYNNGLLEGYNVLMFDPKSYDVIPTQKSRRRKKPTTKVSMGNIKKETDINLYSFERIKLLLRLCGASVGNFERICSQSDKTVSDTDMDIDLEIKNNLGKCTDQPSLLEKYVILLRVDASEDDWRSARQKLEENDCLSVMSNIPMVSANWALDSIAEFKVKDLNKYSQ
jgi:hypothetical protein